MNVWADHVSLRSALITEARVPTTFASMRYLKENLQLCNALLNPGCRLHP